MGLMDKLKGRTKKAAGDLADDASLRRQGRLDFTPPRLTAIQTSGYPTPARRPANSVLSGERLRSAFAASIPDWREGLAETISALPA